MSFLCVRTGTLLYTQNVAVLYVCTGVGGGDPNPVGGLSSSLSMGMVKSICACVHSNITNGVGPASFPLRTLGQRKVK